MDEDNADAQQIERSDRQSQPQNHGRPQTPGDLGEPQQLAARLGRGEFTDERQRGRHIRPNGEADDDGADVEHALVHCQGDAEDSGGINEQVVLINAFAAEFVTEPATEERPERATDRIRSDGGQCADSVVA